MRTFLRGSLVNELEYCTNIEKTYLAVGVLVKRGADTEKDYEQYLGEFLRFKTESQDLWSAKCKLAFTRL